ncbi:hypothetical protein LCGC14_1855510 [marine sediment metagenome]|uniref:Uncharacterized protein n=1 Tax=marine sediment metagenome TaxID=412755 RepID=A0A0F9GXG5_9ZZZZ
MTITITGGTQVHTDGVFQSAASQSAVTSTATQTFPLTHDVVTIDGPTTALSNFWTLADGSEGQDLWIIYNTTGTGGGSTASSGDVHIVPSSYQWGSSITFNTPEQYAHLKFMNSNWHLLDHTTYEIAFSTATVGTGNDIIPTEGVDAWFNLRATGTAATYSLGDGAFEGQEMLVGGVQGGSATADITLTPTSLSGYTSLILGATGPGTHGAVGNKQMPLKWSNANWHMTGPLNLTSTATRVEMGFIAT